MSNTYRELLDLLSPKQPLYLVQVVAVYGDGTSLVVFPGGAQAIVRGSSVAADGYAFVQGGEVRGPAPTLDADTIDVF